MSLPATYTNRNETECCAFPNIDQWDKQHFTFHDQHFIRAYTHSFLFMPLNMGKVMKQLNETVMMSNSDLPSENAIILSRDISPWKAEQLYGVSRPIDGQDNVSLNGEFISMVFEGPYRNVKNWYKEIQKYVVNKGHRAEQIYFFYTTCPKCSKHYGKNYVIALAQIS